MRGGDISCMAPVVYVDAPHDQDALWRDGLPDELSASLLTHLVK